MGELAQEPEGLTVFTRGRFERTRFIDEGQNARIYRAHDTLLHRDVVFKVPAQLSVATTLAHHDFETFDFSEDIMAGLAWMQITDGLRGRYSIWREAELMCAVEHANVLSVLDLGFDEQGKLVLVMPYLRGGTLATRPRPKSWQEVVDLLLEIGEGLAAIHAAGLLHRDLKPSNILFGEDGRPQIADFGLACRIDDDEFMADWVGSDMYMAPEVIAKEGRDVRDDLYAFCVIAYWLFYGHTPFTTISARMSGRVRPSVREAGMSSPVHDVLVRGLAADPNERWPDMPTLLDALKVARTQPPQPRRSWVRRSAWAAGFAAAAALGIALSMSTAEADECEEVTREIETIWNDDVRDELREALGTRKAGDGLQNWTVRWLEVRAIECQAASSAGREPVSTPCSAAARERLRATIHAFQTPHMRDELSFAAVLAELPAPEHCLDDPDNSGWEDDAPAELRDRDVEIEALVRLGDLEAAQRRLDEYAQLAQEYGSPYAQVRALFWDAELRRRTGQVGYARAVFEDVQDQAVGLHAPLLGAEAQMKLVAIAGALGEFDVADAHARGARGMFEEHRPERVAELLRVQGLALLDGPEITRERGVELLARAVELREAQLEAHPGSRERLSQAQESYARGLLAIHRSGEALGLLEVALSSHRDEFGLGTWRTREILRGKFEAYVSRSEWASAEDVDTAIVGGHDKRARNWELLAEDITWMASVLAEAGNYQRAVRVLEFGRNELKRLGAERGMSKIEGMLLKYRDMMR